MAIAGSARSRQPPPSRSRVRARRSGSREPDRRPSATSAVWAALANGTAAHAIEMDDVTTESSLHPGVAVIPAALALAEELQHAVGVARGGHRRLRGDDARRQRAEPRLGLLARVPSNGVAGTFGAAMAAVACWSGCRATRCTRWASPGTHGVGLARVSERRRLDQASRTPAGPATPASPPRCSPRPALPVPPPCSRADSECCTRFSDDADPDRLLADSGEPLQVMRVSIKPYACCRYNHGLIDCMLALAREHGAAGGRRAASGWAC